MKITTNHPSSSYGMPVFLDEEGLPLDYAEGVKLFRQIAGVSAESLAEKCGVHVGQIYNWQAGLRVPPAAAMNVMAGMLDQ